MSDKMDHESVESELIRDGNNILREIEVEWLADNLGLAISSLGYPVGCGIAPSPEHLQIAATKLFERYLTFISLAQQEAFKRGFEAAPKPRTRSDVG